MAKIKITYTYGRYGAGPGVGGNAACSNHHVLPYYVLEYVGLLWVAYAKDHPADTASLNALVGQATVTNMNNAMTGSQGDYFVAEGAPAFQAFTGAFAWLPDNLFTGPAAPYRVADPSQRVEPEKPASFPPKRWNALAALWESVKSVHPPHTTGERRGVEVTDAKAKEIVEAAQRSFRPGATVYSTLVSDWSAVPNKHSNSQYRVDVSVMTQANVDKARHDDPTFDWCKMELASGALVGTEYLRVIQVLDGPMGQIACITKAGQPTVTMGNANFVTQFHVGPPLP